MLRGGAYKPRTSPYSFQGTGREGLEMLHTWVHESLDIMAGHFDKMPVELLTQQVDGFGTATLRKQLLHVVQSEWDWMARVRGRAPRIWSARDFPTLLSVVAGKREVVELTRADLAALSNEALHDVPAHVSDDELFDLLMTEYPGWLTQAKQRGLLPPQ